MSGGRNTKPTKKLNNFEDEDDFGDTDVASLLV